MKKDDWVPEVKFVTDDAKMSEITSKRLHGDFAIMGTQSQ